MSIDRRRFLETAALSAGTLALGCAPPAADKSSAARSVDDHAELPAAIRALKPMREGIVPITDDERKGRIAKAQQLMAQDKIDAIFMEGTTSCFYFTGMRWGQSERTFGVIIPAVGKIAYVCPGFEEDRVRELFKPAFGDEIRVWQEHENPYEVIVGVIKDRGIKYRRVGIEERVRFFIADGIRKAATGIEIVDATPVTAGCRLIKSKAEIALMQHANNVTIAAYKAGLTTLREGMPQGELSRNIVGAFTALGFSGDVSVQFGKWTALPHGSSTPQTLHEGDVVMIDDGVKCEGYVSDITRTVVFGKPTQRQTDVWNTELAAQTAAFNAIKIGATCESVDAAARAVIEKAGFGPAYKVPGLPHRTGHGIGLDGHEWTNFVKGNKTLIAAGMCFSDEPTIAIPGEFGIRLEDDVYIGDDGAHWFSKQSVAIDKPFGD
ncbi:MAG: Xaa-Pro peptidase family protein [Gemmatimonadota bacterium]|nr:Xaa-Pro peptidase family protein [Gemmatimonadota bacterium]